MRESPASKVALFLFCATFGCIAYVVYWFQLIAPPFVSNGETTISRYQFLRHVTRDTRRGTTHFLLLGRDGKNNRFSIPNDCLSHIETLPENAELRATTMGNTIYQIEFNGQQLINHEQVNNSRQAKRLFALAIMAILSFPFTLLAVVDIFKFSRWVLLTQKQPPKTNRR